LIYNYSSIFSDQNSNLISKVGKMGNIGIPAFLITGLPFEFFGIPLFGQYI